MKISRPMRRLLSAVLALGAAGCFAGRRAGDLPPPCPPDVAARARADSTAVPPSLTGNTDLLYPPPGVDTLVRIDFTVAANGRILPQTVRVTGTADAELLRRAGAWARRERWTPAMVNGCALDYATWLTMIPVNSEGVTHGCTSRAPYVPATSRFAPCPE
jgi:hypothetical protein